MIVNDPRATPFSAVQDLGVVVKKVENEQFHVGILYALDNGIPKLCHLLWHLVLRAAGDPDNSYAWLQCGLDAMDRKILSPAFAGIAINGALPYSIAYQGIYFDRDTMQYARTSPGEGLTCATFIMAVFETFAFPLLDAGNWRSRDSDVRWQEHIIKLLAESEPRPTAAHLGALKEHIGDVRFRPEEVAAGVASADTPLSFEDAIERGAEIIDAARRMA